MNRRHRSIIAFLFLILGLSSFVRAEVVPDPAKYPDPDAYNGLRIDFGVSGINMGTANKSNDISWSYSNGTVTGDTISISGTAYNNWGAESTITVRIRPIGLDEQVSTSSWKTTSTQPFNLSYTLPKSCQGFTWSITEEAYYGYGTWRSVGADGAAYRIPSVNVDFSCQPTNATGNDTISCTDATTGDPPEAWSWEIIRDTSTTPAYRSSEQNPTFNISLTKCVDYNVKLTVTLWGETYSTQKDRYLHVCPAGVSPTPTSPSGGGGSSKKVKFGARRAKGKYFVISGTCPAGSTKLRYKCPAGSKIKITALMPKSKSWSLRFPKNLFRGKGAELSVSVKLSNGNWSSWQSKTYKLE